MFLILLCHDVLLVTFLTEDSSIKDYTKYYQYYTKNKEKWIENTRDGSWNFKQNDDAEANVFLNWEMESVLVRKRTRFVFTSEANCVTEQLYRLWSSHSESVDHRSGVLLAGGLVLLETSASPSIAPLEQGNNTWEQAG